MYKCDIGKRDIISVSPSGKRFTGFSPRSSGAPNFEMRYIEIPPDAKRSKTASHPYEQEVYVVSKRGKGEENKTCNGRVLAVPLAGALRVLDEYGTLDFDQPDHKLFPRVRRNVRRR